MTRTWRDKTKETIAEICKDAYDHANKGKKRHVPYAVPEIARAMVEALNNDDEHEAKRLMGINRTGSMSLI